MGLRFKAVGLIAVVLLSAGTIAAIIVSTEMRRSPAGPRTTSQSSTDAVSYSGLGPTTISLSWTMSSDPLFSKYVIQESTASPFGPWFTVANDIRPSTANSYYDSGFSPGGTEWWQVLYYNTNGVETSFTNTLQVTHPPVAKLSFSQATSTNLQLSWDNHATYGGLLSFRLYQLVESINNGGSFTVVTISNANSLGFPVTGLAPGSSYAFYLNTTDQCNGCIVASSSTTKSNIVTINTPGPLSASAMARPNSVDAGQPVYFSCSGAGGVLPYTYAWTFGDGSFGTGASPSHTYSASGMMNAVCTVSDSLGTISDTKPITLPVYTDPSVKSFTLTPANSDLGQRINFFVSTSGGNGSLTFSYANLPAGCSSANSSSLSCTPISSGTYDVTVTVTDQGQETTNSTLRLSIAPPRVLGLPQDMGLAVIFGGILGTSAVAISVVLLLRRKGNVF